MSRFYLTLGLSVLLMGSVQAADIKAGEDKAKTVCAACHGMNGISTNPIWPSLAGQQEQYLVKQLNDFKSGARTDPAMAPMAQILGDEDVANISAYYAQLSCQ